jgi:hypothetical protein
LTVAKEGASWVIRSFNENTGQHNHAMTLGTAFPQDRNDVLKEVYDDIIARHRNGQKAVTILAGINADLDRKAKAEGRETSVILIPQDIYNILERHRLSELNGLTPLEWLFIQLSTDDFYFRDLRDDQNRLQTLFIAPQEFNRFHHEFPDVIFLDSTYKTNRFNMPLLNICGSTNMNKTFTIAAAFLDRENEAQFIWVINTLTEMMTSHGIALPKVIVTDRELALIKAIRHPLLQFFNSQIPSFAAGISIRT